MSEPIQDTNMTPTEPVDAAKNTDQTVFELDKIKLELETQRQTNQSLSQQLTQTTQMLEQYRKHLDSANTVEVVEIEHEF